LVFITNEGCIQVKYREKEGGQALLYWDLGERERKQLLSLPVVNFIDPLPLFIHSSLILFLNSFSSILESSGLLAVKMEYPMQLAFQGVISFGVTFFLKRLLSFERERAMGMAKLSQMRDRDFLLMR
jgi:hypothetical protein